MNPGRRAAAREYAQRVNRAAALLRQMHAPGEVVHAVARLYTISPRQAYRYVQIAQRSRTPLPIPEAKVVFTVKVPASLPVRFRRLVRAERQSLSDLVTRALGEFLQRRGAGARGGGQKG